MSDKVAVVTGANKGIGYAVVRELCKRRVGTVYLTARDKIRGEKAVHDLKNEGYNPIFFQVDVTDKNSIKSLAEHLKEEHGGLDILINNAGVPPKNSYKTTYEDSKFVIDVNYYSVLTIQEIIYPLLKNKARVVNMSSICGHIANLRNKYWISTLTKEDIKVEDINAFVNWFLDSVKNDNLKEEDFAEMPVLAYRISKIALCALTRAQQNYIGRDISINSLHPGFVKTDMTKGAGFLSSDEASQTAVYLVLDAEQSLKGKYIWDDKTEKDWADAQSNLYCKMEFVEKFFKDQNISI